MHLGQDSDKWWALVNNLINLWLPQNACNFLMQEIVAFHDELCSMEFLKL
jgi:hypothetical protein